MGKFKVNTHRSFTDRYIALDNLHMDKYERRRLNLLKLKNEFCEGINKVLAERIERDPTYVSRMLYPEGKQGKKRIADDLIEVIEEKFNLPRGWLDSSPAEEGGAHLQITEQNSDDDTIVVVTNAIASMGLGHPQPEYDQVVDTIRLTRSWVHGSLPKLTSAENLAILTAYGDSMSPTFSDGDLLLVDRGVNQIKLDAVYVIARDGELFVKRVRRRLQDGAVIIKSDNPLFGPDDIIENGERAQLDVLGRVVWAWSGKRL